VSGFALRSLSGSLSGPFVVVHDSSFCDVRSARFFRCASLGWAAGSRSHTIRPALAPHVVHSCEEPGELGHLPSCLTARRPLPRALRARRAGDASGRPAFLRWDYRARVGRVPAATPVHSTDVCCSQILFSKNFQGCCPSLDTRHSAFSHALGSSRFTPSEPASASQLGVRSVVFSGNRRASVPLMPRRPAGTPGGAMSTGVGPQSYAFGAATSGRPEGLGRFHQAA